MKATCIRSCTLPPEMGGAVVFEGAVMDIPEDSAVAKHFAFASPSRVEPVEEAEAEVEVQPFEEVDLVDIQPLGAKVLEEPVVDVRDGADYPFHTGGGYWELSNGERVRGREAAQAAQALLLK